MLQARKSGGYRKGSENLAVWMAPSQQGKEGETTGRCIQSHVRLRRT